MKTKILPWLLLLAACSSSGGSAVLPDDAAIPDDTEQPGQNSPDSGGVDGSVQHVGNEKPGHATDGSNDAGAEVHAQALPDASSSGPDAGPPGVCEPCSGGMVNTGACQAVPDDPVCLAPCGNDPKLRCFEGACMPWYWIISGAQRLECKALDGQIRVNQTSSIGVERGTCIVDCSP